MELFVPVRSDFRNGWVQYDHLVLDFNLKYSLEFDLLTTDFTELTEFNNPVLDKLLKSLS